MLRFKAAGTNLERENDVFCAAAVGCKRGAVRTIRVEPAQVFPEMVSCKLTPPVPITVGSLLAGYRGSGLTIIWFNYQVIALCFTREVEAQWSGSLAAANYLAELDRQLQTIASMLRR